MPEKNLDFDKPVNRKNTDSLKFDFAKRRGKPADVLPFWVADMDFKTSSYIIDALHNKAEHGIYGYTEAREDYFCALSKWMKTHHDMDIKINWVVKTPGVVFALAMAVKAFTEKGDKVLIQQPVYYPFSEVIEDNDRVVVSSDLVLKGNRYTIDFDDFEKKIKENNIKLFLFCSPQNPTGRVWTLDELREIARICLKYKVIVVSDEIHEDFTFKGHKHIPLINAEPKIKDFCITATAPTKTFNIAGLQISNIIIPNAFLRHEFKREVTAAGYSQQNTFGVEACKAAYTYGNDWYEAVKKYIDGNLCFVRKYLEENLPEVKLIEPEGTYLLWLDFRKLKLSNDALEDLIVNKAKLWLDSGAIFGKTGEGFQRINIATQRAVLKKGLDKLRFAVEGLHKESELIR